jgi:sugar phosphate isomerase/epimerase
MIPKKLFVKYSRLSVAFFLFCIISCNGAKENQTVVEDDNIESKPFFKLSLAQWSFHRAIINKEMSPLDFAQKAKELGFEGIEYVSWLYKDELEKEEDQKVSMQNLLETLKAKSEKYKVQNVLIMVDGEGDLASADDTVQNMAVENHKKWVDAAQFLSCHSIRVNLNGTKDPKEWVNNAAIGLTKLAIYAEEKGVNIIVENHGGLSSNAAMLASVMRAINKSNCGTLPDFGNFCIERKDSECIESYDMYKGVEEMMPFAKAVSAKSYDFDAIGLETTIDYKKMLQIVKNAGYTGFIGVEYEGSRLSEEEGTIATKKLLLKVVEEHLL